VFAYCLLACNHKREAATELTQDVFVRMYKGLPALKNPEKFRSWLFTIAANVARNKWSAKGSNRRAMAAFMLEQDVHRVSDEQVERQSRIDVVKRALMGIEDDQMRQIALLKYTEPEHTTRQIAEKLGIPHGTVTVKLMRFRKRFKDVLVAALGEEEAVV